MKLLVGLGNPGEKYLHTRHNIGFRVVDEIANRFESSFNRSENKEHTQISMILPNSSLKPPLGPNKRRTGSIPNPFLKTLELISQKSEYSIEEVNITLSMCIFFPF